ncbi:MAG TPA: pentapeptide repeat-containing protein [Streptosporangiaceae bacterium]|nr:pentapeptide repeat-containing protein [Streptosporangiaceae bacterium]
MSRSASRVPRELADLPYAAALSPHRGDLEAGAAYDTVHFDQASFDAQEAPGARFLDCAFTGVSLHDAGLRRCRFTGVWLSDVRVTLSDLAESEWSDATFSGGILAGAEAYGSTLTRVVFTGCKLDSVNFREAELTEVSFTDCLLRDVDLSGASLRRASFAGSRLTGVDISRARLDRVDLRGAELGLVVGADSLRGAIITSGQLAAIAPVLADSLGIVVDDGQER